MARISAIDVQIGKRVRARRDEVGLTQAGLSKHLGVTFQQLQKYERGENRISASTLVLMARAMRCTAADLLGEAPTVSPGDEGLGDLFQIWTRISDEQRTALLALMRSMT